jgi:hypothetical protein
MTKFEFPICVQPNKCAERYEVMEQFRLATQQLLISYEGHLLPVLTGRLRFLQVNFTTLYIQHSLAFTLL